MEKQTSSMVASTIAAAIPGVSHFQIMDVGDSCGRGESPPEMCEGYLMKRKKWPRKGWHKRYFHLEAGILRYAKSPNAIKKNKVHGKMDVGMCVMSHKKNALTIDLDAEDTIFHVKAKSIAMFHQWVTGLRLHREYHNKNKDTTLTNNLVNHGCAAQSPISHQPDCEGLIMNLSENLSSDNAANAKQDIALVWHGIQKLSQMLGELAMQSPQVSASSSFNQIISANSPTLSKKERKQSKKLAKKGHKASISNSSTGETTSMLSVRPHSSATNMATTTTDTTTQQPKPSSGGGHLLEPNHNMSYSNPDLTLLTASNSTTSAKEASGDASTKSKSNHTTPTRPAVLSLSNSVVGDGRGTSNGFDKHTRFINQATEVYKLLSTLTASCEEREKTIQKNNNTGGGGGGVKGLKATSLKQLAAENQHLRARLERIHADSAPLLSPPELLGNLQTSGSEKTIKQSTLRRMPPTRNPIISQMSSESQLSINDTISDMFYDAEEYLLSGESSSESEAGSETNDDVSTDDVSEPEDSECVSAPDVSDANDSLYVAVKGSTGRRQRLPVERRHSSGGLLSILRRNIGRDLSKISMPVTMNEPLNVLQHLCEELEYSDLLDKAAKCEDKFDRMVLVAAFAVSSYGATYHRAGQKPFNPILGETYECIREDRGFRFVAEQVSHHPPVSACHCDGENFEFWQDTHYKNTFWGRTLEIVPIGKVNVRLKSHETVYQWKKVTSCVHNMLTGNRWVEHYGDMHITGGDVTCKLNFMKGSYWSSKKGDFKGMVYDRDGEVVRQLHGRWFEGLFCGLGSKSHCVWRTGAMPPDFEKYYGFTRFAIELNEIEPGHEKLLPRTDTRFRPDQRLLEEGDVDQASAEKQRVEEMQRERRKQRELNDTEYKPIFFCKVGGEKADDEEAERWVFKGDYWKMRRDGFASNEKIPKLW